MELIIRETEDSKEILKALEVRKIVFIDEQNVSPELEIDEYDKSATHFIVLYNGETIGTARVVFSDKIGKVGRICILKEFRNKGIGSRLMEKIIEYSKNIGLECLYLASQINAIPFYEKIGFIVKGKEFMDAGISHKKMIIILKDFNSAPI